jgi:copper chaperone
MSEVKTEMETTVLKVDGMSCEHCVKAVTNAAGGLVGVSNVSVDLAGGTVSFAYDPAVTPLAQIKAEIEDQGYDVV